MKIGSKNELNSNSENDEFSNSNFFDFLDNGC